MKTRGTKKEREARRMLAAGMFEQGIGPCEVGRRLGVTHGAVSQWKTAWELFGKDGLESKPHPGGIPRLSEEDCQRLAELLLAGPREHGYTTDLWTLPRVAELIRREFGVEYDPSHVSRILKRMGWSSQKPERRAREQDEAAVEEWRQRQWPRIKKNATGRQKPCGDG